MILVLHTNLFCFQSARMGPYDVETFARRWY